MDVGRKVREARQAAVPQALVRESILAARDATSPETVDDLPQRSAFPRSVARREMEPRRTQPRQGLEVGPARRDFEREDRCEARARRQGLLVATVEHGRVRLAVILVDADTRGKVGRAVRDREQSCFAHGTAQMVGQDQSEGADVVRVDDQLSLTRTDRHEEVVDAAGPATFRWPDRQGIQLKAILSRRTRAVGHEPESGTRLGRCCLTATAVDVLAPPRALAQDPAARGFPGAVEKPADVCDIPRCTVGTFAGQLLPEDDAHIVEEDILRAEVVPKAERIPLAEVSLVNVPLPDVNAGNRLQAVRR